jgi:ATP phosphoribosyltransferase regulatory subunit
MGCKRLVVPLVPAGIPAALALAARWRESEAVELELLDRSPEEIEAYARRCRIPEIAWVQADGSYHISPVKYPEPPDPTGHCGPR